ncbi:hypothetical protein WICPIJ_003050 [Wickerhamomyces pijperi]|uniref:Signal peptidase subunit 3 n=1 Tax=Wickerhamomyces pijperi TaxID=599730 RepID=A0A9P8TND0_WICPI|nr:hypothetical protein WICPIJ_003050 [Wickerhamomyces pijperi]
MFSIYQRGQSVLNFAVTLVGFISAFIFITSLIQLQLTDSFHKDSSISTISTASSVKFSKRFGSVGGKAKENNKIVFDLQSDLTDLFNWNTKQVFVYLTAEYPGKTPESSNKVVYWDKIITSKEDANLTLTNERAKYSVWDVEESFKNRDATLKLEWNIQPYVGLLTYGETEGIGSFTFPDVTEEKPKSQKKKANRRKNN